MHRCNLWLELNCMDSAATVTRVTVPGVLCKIGGGGHKCYTRGGTRGGTRIIVLWVPAQEGRFVAIP